MLTPKCKMSFEWLIVFLVAVSIDQSLSNSNEHCEKACTECPDTERRSLCLVYPVSQELPCLCALRRDICFKRYENPVFYSGSCSEHRQSFSHLITFQGNKMFLIQNQKISKIINKKRNLGTKKILKKSKNSQRSGQSYVINEYLLPKQDPFNVLKMFESVQEIFGPQKSDPVKEICDLFFNNDPTFKALYKERHFQCPSVSVDRMS